MKANILFFILALFVFSCPSTVMGQKNRYNSDSLNEEVRRQISLSRMYLKSDYDLAIHSAQKATELADLHKGNEIRIQAWKNLGFVYQNRRLDSATIHAYMIYLELSKKSKSPLIYADALDVIGGVHLMLENFEQGVHYYKKALHINTIHKDSLFIPARKIMAYQNLFIAYRVKGELDSALKYVFEANNLCKADSLQYRIDLAKTRILLADLYLEKNNPAQSKYYAELALSDIEGLDLIAEKNLSYFIIALANRALNNKVIAFEWMDKAIESAKKFGNKEILIEINENLSEWYSEDGELELAYIHLKRADSIKALHNNEEAAYTLAQKEVETQIQSTIQEEKQKKTKLAHKIIAIGGIVLLIVAFLLNHAIKLQTNIRHIRQEIQFASEKIRNLLSSSEQRETKLKEQSALIEKKSFQEFQSLALLDQAIENLSSGESGEEHTHKRKVVDLLGKVKQYKSWDEFELNFHQIHESFFYRLQQQHPDLTPHERKLCALLLMNMSTKEIANMTGQSLRAVELARIRLRKKLKLTHSDLSLPQYLSTI